MPTAKNVVHRVIENTAVPYRSYSDITSDEPNLVAGANVLTNARQVMERRPGFADQLEHLTPLTNFTAAAREFKWSKWGGTRFFSMVCDVSGGTAKVYKFEKGADDNYRLIFTSTSSTPFDFVISNNTCFYGNGTDMRAYDGSTERKWGISRPSTVATISTSGTGISALAGGYYYRYTYYNSSTGHESSASDLSACTGNFSNKQVNVTVVASSDSQVDKIRIYRTTDGGTTDTSEMQEISGSPFANASTAYVDTTSDSGLGTRVSPGTTSNDPPPAGYRMCVYAGRIFLTSSTSNNQTWFSALEENSNGVPEESFPSGSEGNYYPWDMEVTSHVALPDGVACYTRGRIWKIQGDRRDNFVRYKLVERRGAISHTATLGLGTAVAWLDTASQVWHSDLGEIGFDIRTDLAKIDHSKAYLTAHISNTAHWLMLLDGANGKIYCFDLDRQVWMSPWVVTANSTCLNSGEESAGGVKLSIALGGTNFYKSNASVYRDGSSPYTAYATFNLLKTVPKDNPELTGYLDWVAVETNANTNSDVSVLLDDDPGTGTYNSIAANAQDPFIRPQGTNIVKKEYLMGESLGMSERASVKLTWATEDRNFILYTLDLAWHPKPNA